MWRRSWRRTAGSPGEIRRCSRWGRAGATWAVVGALAGLVCGCAAPGATPGAAPGEEAGPEAEGFAPLTLPRDFDEARARMRLADIPDDPPAPDAAEAVADPELPRQALRHLESARRLFQEQRYSETIADVERVLRYNANHAEAHRLLAAASLLSGHDHRARQSAERALALNPDDLISHYILGRMADRARRVEEALAHYRTALKCTTTPDNRSYAILTHYHLGLLLHGAGYYAAAIEQLEAFEAAVAVLDVEATDNAELETVMRVHRGPASIRLGRAYGYLGRYGEAADAMKTAVDHAPRDGELRSEYIRMLARAGRMDEAGQEATRFVADTDGRKEAVELLLAVYRHAGRPDEGARAIREVIETQPDNTDLWLLYVDALLAARRHDEAAKTLGDLVTRHPQLADARWRLIGLNREREDWPGWLLALAEEISERPHGYLRAGRELARAPEDVLRRIADQGWELPAHATPPVPAAPEDALVAAALDYLFGAVCEELERVEDADRFFERSARRSPDFLPATMGRAGIYIRRSEWAVAIRAVEEVRAMLDEPSSQIERLLGQCYDGLDRIEEAIEHYRTAARLNPEDATSNLLLGRLYARTGNEREAIRAFQAAVAADRNNMRAREALLRQLLRQAMGPGAAPGSVQADLNEMQRLAPRDPATRRCTALITFAASPARDRQAYLEILRELIEDHPRELQTWEDLAETLIPFREYDEALKAVNAMLDIEPRHGRALELLAHVQMKQLEFEDALETYDRMIGIHPRRMPWLLGRTELYMIVQDFDGAAESWRSVLAVTDSDEDRLRHRTGLMQALRYAGRFDDARRLAVEWLAEADESEHPTYRWFLLAADHASGEHQRYLERCRAWLKEAPDDVVVRGWLVGAELGIPVGDRISLSEDILELLAFAIPELDELAEPAGLNAVENFEEAIQMAFRWLAESPDERLWSKWLINVLDAAGRHEEAIEIARGLLASSSGHGEQLLALDTLQQLYRGARRYEEAITTIKDMVARIRRAVDEERNHVRRFYLALVAQHRQSVLVDVYAQAKRFDDAISHLNRLLTEIDEDHERDRKADLLRMLAYVHQRQDDLPLTLQRLREAHALSPNNPGFNNDLGYTLADAGQDIDEAERMIRFAVAERPRTAAYLDSLGWVLYKRGDMRGAVLWLERAANLPEGQDAVIYDHLGDAYWRLGDREVASGHWNRALEQYRKDVARGSAHLEIDLHDRVTAKLAALREGREPEVAPLAEEQAPATQEAATDDEGGD